MTREELDSLMIGDKVRKSGEYDLLTVVSINTISTSEEECVELVCKTLKGMIQTGKYKNFVIPKKFVKVDKSNGTKVVVTLSEISNQDGLYSYSPICRPIKEMLLNGEKLYTRNYIFRFE